MCRKTFFLLTALMLFGGCVPHKTEPVFHSEVISKSVPWTNLNFRNDPDSFQFAIVGDRSREGLPYGVVHMQWTATNLHSQRPELFGRLEF